ncbi:MAG: hypothetical protein KDL87_17285, partial [Verrucomicrobiae bacterium]|nr:hypothetical protein [Verrucomicrobiae bacterium]
LPIEHLLVPQLVLSTFSGQVHDAYAEPWEPKAPQGDASESKPAEDTDKKSDPPPFAPSPDL